MEQAVSKTNTVMGLKGRTQGNLSYFSTTEMDRKSWLNFRSVGIGGSDVGSILGLNPWRSALEVFMEKIGLHERQDVPDPVLFFGNELEDMVAKWWSHYDIDDPLAFIDNAQQGKVIRKSRRINAFVRNKKFPWLLASLDRRIVGTRTPLEIKTIRARAAAMYESGIPPYHHAQALLYAVVMESDDYELAHFLLDDRELLVSQHKVDYNQAAELVQKTEQFWNNVLKARPLAQELIELRDLGLERSDRAKELDRLITELEPAADGSKAYEQFMKERYKNPLDRRPARMQDLQAIRAEREAHAAVKAAQEAHQLRKNELIRLVGSAERIDCGESGYVSYAANTRGVKSLRVQYKSA